MQLTPMFLLLPSWQPSQVSSVLVGLLAFAIATAYLWDAYKGVWQRGRGEPLVKATRRQRAWSVFYGVVGLCVGGFLLFQGISPNSTAVFLLGHGVGLLAAQGAIGLLMASLCFYAVHRVNRVGEICFRGRVIRAAWYHKLLLAALGLALAWGSWAAFLSKLLPR